MSVGGARRFKSILISLVFALVVVPARTASAQLGILATINVHASPDPYNPLSGHHLLIHWTYEDMGHVTDINLIREPEGTLVYSARVPGLRGENSASLGALLLADGNYTVEVIPEDFPDFRGYGTLTVRTPPPPGAPSVSLTGSPQLGQIRVDGVASNASAVWLQLNGTHYGMVPVVSGQYTASVHCASGLVHTLRARSVAADGRLSEWSPDARFAVHKVSAGDDLWKLSLHYYGSGDRGHRIASANGLSGNSPLLLGWRLLVPDALRALRAFPPQGLNPEVALSQGYFETCGFTPDPISTSTGNLTYATLDLMIPNKPVIELRRQYNSMDTYSGPMGSGWRSTYDLRATPYVDGRVQVLMATGARYIFTPQDGGAYRSPDGVRHRLEPLGTGWRLVAPDRVAYDFTPNGLLATIRDPNSNVLTLTYDGMGRLVRVDGTGGHLNFTYGAQGYIERIIDHTGLVHAYGYTGDLLTSYAEPEGDVWAYLYDSAGRLSGVIDPDGVQIVTNEYCPSTGRVLRQLDARGLSTVLDYYPDEGRTVVTLPDGTSFTDLFDDNGRLVARTDALGQTTHYAYGPDGNLSVMTDALGFTTRYHYDSRGNRTEVVNPRGGSTFYEYDNHDNLVRVADPLGHSALLTYDDRGNLTAIAESPGSITRFVFDDRGNLVEVVAPDGGTTRLRYDYANNLIEIVAPDGVRTSFAYDALNRVATETDPLGNTTCFVRDARGRPIQVTDPLGGVLRYHYRAGRLTSLVNPLGAALAYDYDGSGNITRVTDPLGHAFTLGYDAGNRLIRVSDPLGAVTSYEYDPVGRLKAVVDALGNRTEYRRDALGRVVAATFPGTARYQYEYDPEGRATAITDPAGNTRRYEYDAAGQVIAVTGESGDRTYYAYDPAGRLAGITDAMGCKWAFAYDACGRLTSMAFPNGGVVAYRYDMAGRIAAETDPLGEASTFAYDPAGRQAARRDPLGNESTFQYDALGRVMSFTDAEGGRFHYVYDLAGNLVAVTDPRGGRTEFQYDLAGNLVRVADAAGGETLYGYDLRGRLTAYRAPGGETRAFCYDALGRIVAETDGLGRTTTFAYDGRGNLIQVGYPHGAVLHQTYDLRDLVVAIENGNELRTEFGYDAAGRRVRMSDNLGEWQYSYDALGRLVRSVDYQGRVQEYGYGPAGERSWLRYPDGRTARYDHDRAGRLIKAAWNGAAVEYRYSAAGQLTGVLHPGGVLTTLGYNKVGRPVLIQTARPQEEPLLALGYGYDPAGNTVWREREETDSGVIVRTDYEYDALERLVAVLGPGGLLRRYAYDPSGNRLSLLEVGTAPEPDPAEELLVSDEMESAGGPVRPAPPPPPGKPPKEYGDRLTTYEYDAAGQLIRASSSEGTLEYSYDPNGRLVEVTRVDEDGHSRHASYGYDAAGRLITHTDRWGQLAQYKYAGDGLRVGAAYTLLDRVQRTVPQAPPAVPVPPQTGGATPPGRGESGPGKPGKPVDPDGPPSVTPPVPSQTPGLSDWAHSFAPGLNRDLFFSYRTTAFDLVSDLGEPLRRILCALSEEPGAESTYLWGIGPAMMEDGEGSVYFYGLDAQGSVKALFDSTGKPLASYDYDEFGQLGPYSRFVPGHPMYTPNLLGYTGEPYDPVLRGVYLRTRYYEPRSGRFAVPDAFPALAFLPHSLNRYTYADNNPLRYIDPWGLIGAPPTADYGYDVTTSVMEMVLGYTRAIVSAAEEHKVPPELVAAIITKEQMGWNFFNNGTEVPRANVGTRYAFTRSLSRVGHWFDNPSIGLGQVKLRTAAVDVIRDFGELSQPSRAAYIRALEDPATNIRYSAAYLRVLHTELLGNGDWPVHPEDWQRWAARYNGFGAQAWAYGEKVLEYKDEYLSVWGER